MSSIHRKQLEVSTDSIFIEVGRKTHQQQQHNDKAISDDHKGKSLSNSIRRKFKKEVPQHLPPTRKPLFWNKYEIALPTLSELCTMVGWLAAVAVCISYILYSSWQFISSRNNPTTATSYVESVPMYFPAITICNWNAMVECDYCNLTLKYVTRVNSNKGIVEEFVFHYEQVEILQNGQLFRCLVFNNGSNSAIQATEIGYAGTITFYFKLPPVPESRDARFGLQISFHENGTIPSVFSETNYAISGYDNYFSLTKVLTNRLKPNKEDGLKSVRWTTLLSLVELTQTETDMVVISVAYSTLNLHVITEMYTASFESLFGQIAGMIGIFMGLDILKFIRGLLLLPYSAKQRSIRRIWENFN